MDTMDIMKRAGGVCGGVLVTNMQPTKNGSTSDTTTKFYGPLSKIK